MAKSKSFLDMADVENPVAQFISTVSPVEKEPEPTAVPKEIKTPVREENSKKESVPEVRVTLPDTESFKPISGRTFKKAELKTRRVQLLLKQSVYDKIMRVSDDIGVSMNEFIHMLVENYQEK